MYTFFPHNLQVDADFAVNLLGELVRAYLAATNILYQVSQSVHLSESAICLFFFFFFFLIGISRFYWQLLTIITIINK